MDKRPSRPPGESRVRSRRLGNKARELGVSAFNVVKLILGHDLNLTLRPTVASEIWAANSLCQRESRVAAWDRDGVNEPARGGAPVCSVKSAIWPPLIDAGTSFKPFSTTMRVATMAHMR